MTRQRLTWTNRKASPPPATPGYEEPSIHPAAYPDPAADQYENGDTSSWAEDPHPGPYPNTPHPALPGTEAPQGHPATDPKHYFPEGVGKQAAAQLRAATEVKAAKCIRIAQAMLGPRATVAAIEDQALDLMNLTERQILAALKRISSDVVSNYTLTEPRKGEDLEPMAEEEEKKATEEEPEEKEEETASKKAAKFAKLAKFWSKKAEEEEETEEEEADEEASKKASVKVAKAPAKTVKKAEEEETEEEEYDEEASKKASVKSAKKATVAKKAEEEETEEETDEDKEAAKKAAHYAKLASFWAAKLANKTAEESFVEKMEKAKEEKAEKDKKASKKATEMPGDQNSPEHYKYRERGVLAEDLEAEDEDEKKLAAMLAEEAAKSAGESSEDDEDEKKLAAMLAEEASKTAEEEEDDEDEKKLAALIKEYEAKKASKAKKAEKTEEKAEEEETKEASLDPEEEALLASMLDVDGYVPESAPVLEPESDILLDDPMGLLDEGDPDAMSEEEMGILYGAKYAGEETEEEAPKAPAKEEVKKEAKVRTASQKPQPRRASTGVSRLGATPAPSKASEVDELSKLWGTAPDLSLLDK